MDQRTSQPGRVTPIWARPGPLGKLQSTSALGSVVSPLIAGFSLTTITLLLTTEAGKRPALSEWAIAALAIAAGLSIYTIQFTTMAIGYGATPDARLTWQPEAAADPRELQHVREKQAKEMKLVNLYLFRAGLCYDFGILAFLAGLGLVVFPSSLSFAGAIPVAVTAAAVLIEIWWMVASYALKDGWLRRSLLPSRDDVALDPVLPPLNQAQERAIIKGERKLHGGGSENE